MTIIFACTEQTGFKNHGTETTSATMFRSPQSRNSGIHNASGAGTIDLPSPLNVGRFRFYRRGGTWTAAGEMFTMYDSSDVPILRAWKVGNGTWRLEEWTGTWVVLFALTYNTTIAAHEFLWNFETQTVEWHYADTLSNSAALNITHNPVSYIVCAPVGGTGTTAHREGWSEIVVSNNERTLDQVGVETKFPVATATDTDGVGLFSTVNENTNDGGANVITMNAADQRRSFTSSARTGTGSTVLAITVAADLKYVPGQGTPTRARFYIKIGGIRYYSPAFDLTVVYQGYQYAWNANPATDSPWTVAEANNSSLEWGVESVA